MRRRDVELGKQLVARRHAQHAIESAGLERGVLDGPKRHVRGLARKNCRRRPDGVVLVCDQVERRGARVAAHGFVWLVDEARDVLR